MSSKTTMNRVPGSRKIYVTRLVWEVQYYVTLSQRERPATLWRKLISAVCIYDSFTLCAHDQQLIPDPEWALHRFPDEDHCLRLGRANSYSCCSTHLTPNCSTFKLNYEQNPWRRAGLVESKTALFFLCIWGLTNRWTFLVPWHRSSQGGWVV